MNNISFKLSLCKLLIYCYETSLNFYFSQTHLLHPLFSSTFGYVNFRFYPDKLSIYLSDSIVIHLKKFQLDAICFVFFPVQCSSICDSSLPQRCSTYSVSHYSAALSPLVRQNFVATDERIIQELCEFSFCGAFTEFTASLHQCIQWGDTSTQRAYLQKSVC